jgi:hypothetical protein
VAAHHDLEQILRRGGRELSHPEIIHDEQRDGAHVGEVALAGAVERRVSKFLQQQVGLAVGDLVSLLDGSKAKGLERFYQAL